MFWPAQRHKHVGISIIPTGPTVRCSITRVQLCLCMWESAPRRTGRGGGRELARCGSDSVLLQDQVFQLVCWAEQEGRGLPVPCDELPHRCHLWRAELSGSAASATSLTVTVGAGGGGVWADRFHTQICGTCGGKQNILGKSDDTGNTFKWLYVHF